MPKLNSKGQGAMEYLMTYSWAILVVVTVGLVLWQLGIFNMGQSTVTYTGLQQLKPVLPTVVYLPNQTFQVSLLNTMGTSILVTDAGMEETLSSSPVCTQVRVNGVDTTLQDVSVTQGAALTLTGLCPQKEIKDAYAVYLNVSYTITTSEAGATVDHLEQGTITGSVEG